MTIQFLNRIIKKKEKKKLEHENIKYLNYLLTKIIQELEYKKKNR